MYRVVHKAISRREGDVIVTYEAGDEFEPSDSELQSFSDRLEEVVEEDSVDETPTGDATETGFQLGDLTVAEVEAELATGEYDAFLDEIAEQAERKGVQAAIESRRG